MLDLDDPAPSGDLHAAIEQFYFAYRGFTDRPDRILERRGLGRVHHRILYFIGRRPDVSVRGLLDLLAVSKQALNAPLRQLIEMGLVRAVASTQDRRVKRLALTPAGRKLEAELTEAQTRHLRAAFDRAGKEAQRGWRAVMEELVKG
ncbi:MarR family transcriptional regulator [Caulobacter sp. BK020]|uniref:MarR family winged helix-turn-helix transcriptional regulator n=1 Tax=Caulobacter sp. BK020 TaxID=2512117 RepID=UPI0010484903|nr:MarR family transcriptional regulator [Caulobacter sp. BK020]TCS11968.1 DNA-binding MarR family transcriptional regulator [Caulobacter sp. BK020]